MKQAANSNIQASDGDGVIGICKQVRSLKHAKNLRWLQKANLGMTEHMTELPKMPEMEKINILKSSCEKEICERDKNGLLKVTKASKYQPSEEAESPLHLLHRTTTGNSSDNTVIKRLSIRMREMLAKK